MIFLIVCRFQCRYIWSSISLVLQDAKRITKFVAGAIRQKRLHGPGFEPGTPAVLRQCHNQLDHPRWTTTSLSIWLKLFTITYFILSLWHTLTTTAICKDKLKIIANFYNNVLLIQTEFYWFTNTRNYLRAKNDQS